MSVLEVLRLFFGGLFVLFVPGFVWSYVFFAKKDIDWIERVALSFGLSIALVPLAVFWLNWVFNLKITFLNTLLVVCVLTAIPLIYFVIKESSWGREAVYRVNSILRRGKRG